jgi:hypothetical protein
MSSVVVMIYGSTGKLSPDSNNKLPLSPPPSPILLFRLPNEATTGDPSITGLPLTPLSYTCSPLTPAIIDIVTGLPLTPLSYTCSPFTLCYYDIVTGLPLTPLSYTCSPLTPATIYTGRPLTTLSYLWSALNPATFNIVTGLPLATLSYACSPFIACHSPLCHINSHMFTSVSYCF